MQVRGGDATLTFHQLLAGSTSLAGAAKKGPTLTYTGGENNFFWNSSGLLQRTPHQLLKNSRMNTQSGSPLVPAGWGGGASGATACPRA